MWIAELILALVAQEVIGLKPGESASPVIPEAGQKLLGPFLRGRLIDGVSSVPVEGAAVELWTEGDGPEPRIFAHDTSRGDGSFRLEDLRADKIMIRAKGYRSTLIGRGDRGEIMLLPLAKHLGLQVVDLDGNPIAGAHAESRQTCAHAPPAYVGVSNAAGVFDLATFPPLEDNPEIVVSARGYGAVLLQLPALMLAAGGLEVRLPKRRPIAFLVVDAMGTALANRRVAFGEEPTWCAVASDSNGRVVLDSPFFGREFVSKIEERGSLVFLASGRAPNSFEPTLAFIQLAEGQAVSAAPDSTVPVHVVDVTNHVLDLSVAAIREHGATRHGLEGVRFLNKDWGHTTIIAGGSFTGWKEAVNVLVAPIETTISVTREPVLEIQLPADQFWLVHVQAGDDSITLENPGLPLRQPVPAGKAITVCAVGERETRLARLGHIDEDRAVDLTRESSIVAKPLDEGTRIVHRISAADVAFAGEVRLPGGQLELDAPSGALEFEVPANANFECYLGGDNSVPRLIGPWDPAEIAIHFPRRGSLTVHGNLHALFAGGDEGNALEGGGFRVNDLAPGPLLVELVKLNGDLIRISLVLGDGEQRELTLR